MKTKLAITGAAGRMGGRLIALANADAGLEWSGAMERPDHPMQSRDAGEVAGAGPIGLMFIQVAKLSGCNVIAVVKRDSQVAALAARAVWEAAPDKFYDWHRAMFDHQDEENAGWGTKDDIIALTKTIPGIDAAKVEQLMTDHAKDYQKEVEADGAEGAVMGISGTPGAIIGKQLILGAQAYERYKTAIDAGLSPAP